MTYVRDWNRNGDVADRLYYCDRRCWQDSMDAAPPVPRDTDGHEEGGEWPCLELDYPVACGYCGAWITVNLTEAGQAYAIELMETATRSVADDLAMHYPELAQHVERGDDPVETGHFTGQAFRRGLDGRAIYCHSADED